MLTFLLKSVTFFQKLEPKVMDCQMTFDPTSTQGSLRPIPMGIHLYVDTMISGGIKRAWGGICPPSEALPPTCPPVRRNKWQKSAIFGKFLDFFHLGNEFFPLNAHPLQKKFGTTTDSGQFCKILHTHILHTYYVQTEWSHSLFPNTVQVRHKGSISERNTLNWVQTTLRGHNWMLLAHRP